MKHLVAAALLGLAACSCAFAQSAGPLVIRHARVLNEAGDALLNERTIIIDGERIGAVTPDGEARIPAGATVIDGAGLTILPGLIDLHTHLLLHPYDEAPWNVQVLNESLGLRTARAVVAAKATLDAGFTTIRELGTEGAGYADVGVRDAIEQGIIPGPRIFASTRAIVASGSYGPSGFDPRWAMPVGAQVADGVDGVRKVVREQIAAGADWIKVYADYRRRQGDPSTPTFSQAELDAIVDEARSAGLPVAAHATTDEAIRRAVLAGVNTIEHGYEASEDVLQLMHDRGVVLCPTLAASEAMARYAGWTPDQLDHPRIVAARALIEKARRSGVTIACGSDAGVFSHGDNAREIELMVEYGLTPAEAIRAATSAAASVLGRDDQFGSVRPGLVADLIAVRGNPLEDVAVLRSPTLVIKAGEIVADVLSVDQPDGVDQDSR